jgi:hypothetical protein
MLLLALLLATTGSAATGDRPGPAAVLERLRAIARDGDVDGMRRLVHPRKGLRDGGVRVAAREIDRDYLIHTGYLKAARSQRPARCDRAFKRGKARCEIVLSRSNGGFRYTFKATKAGVFLISTSVWDG